METINQSETIRIKRISQFEYFFGDSGKQGIMHVARALTFNNPSPFAYSRTIRKFDRRRLTFRIGMLRTIEKYASENDLNVVVDDFDHEVPKIEIDDRMSGKFIHQRMAVEAFYKRRFGIIVVPTRGGKTFIAAEILRIFLMTEHEGKFLFITDNVTLFNQAFTDFTNYFSRYGGLDVGFIKEGHCDTSKRVTIAMIQTIQSVLSNRCRDLRKKKDLISYLKGLKFLCVDEVHDNCSDSKLKIYKMMHGLEYQLCLSATPYRSGQFVQNLKLMEWSGDVIYEISEEVLRERGVLSEYRVLMLMVDHDSTDCVDTDYSVLLRKLIYDSKVRNGLLLRLIEMLREMGLKTLLMFHSVEHGRMISEMTGIPFISGETSSDERESRKSEFLDARGGMLLASDIFKKGVTLPQVEVLINVDGGLEDANTIQKKGRVLGSTDTKNRSMVIDFFDMYRVHFKNHSLTRLNTYVNSVGDDSVDILDSGNGEWIGDAKNIIRRWFNVGDNYTDMQ
jgi:superfamily II DNA or RNA helicase